MKIYLHSESAEKSAKYPVIVSPAGDDEFVSSENCLKEWRNAKGDAVQFRVDFVYGAAEVQDELAGYMVARGIAHRSRILRRVQQFFDAAGKVITGGVFDESGRPVSPDANPGGR
jgi:hypothetical protein